jgi:hypothetical protein
VDDPAAASSKEEKELWADELQNPSSAKRTVFVIVVVVVVLVYELNCEDISCKSLFFERCFVCENSRIADGETQLQEPKKV